MQFVKTKTDSLKMMMIIFFMINIIAFGIFMHHHHSIFGKKAGLDCMVNYHEQSIEKNDNKFEIYSKQFIPNCPIGNGLVGSMRIEYMEMELSYMKMANVSIDVKSNDDLGKSLSADHFSTVLFEPANCKPTSTVAIIIPFRARERHLRILLGHLIPVLERQLIRFSIFILAQTGENTFNKGRLMNTGFEFARKAGVKNRHPFDCYIFHDVDLLVENDKLQYGCSKGGTIKHLSTAIDIYDYRWLGYGITVGGVLAMTEDQFEKVNGYSNMYWGWGGEDDDMYARIRNQSLKIERPDKQLARYTMISHGRDKNNEKGNIRHELLRNASKRLSSDGLSSLSTNISSVERFSLFVKVNVEVT